MENKFIKIGTKLTLIFKEPGKGPEEYYSKIIDLQKDRLIIDYPTHKRTKRTKLFPVGTAFKANFVGSDQAVYEFPTKIIARVKVKFPAMAMAFPKAEEIQRIQRRQFVRIDASIDVAVHRQNGTEVGFSTVTSDISGGGISVVLPKDRELEMDEVIELWMVLPFQSGKYHYIHTTAKVVFLQDKNGVRTAALKYLSLKSNEQQLIISFCFEKQREMRKKELS